MNQLYYVYKTNEKLTVYSSANEFVYKRFTQFKSLIEFFSEIIADHHKPTPDLSYDVPSELKKRKDGVKRVPLEITTLFDLVRSLHDASEKQIKKGIRQNINQ